MNLAQALWLFIDDREGLRAEMLDDALGGNRPDTADQTGPEILANAFNRRRKERAKRRDAELSPVLWMSGPHPFELNAFARIDAAHLPDRHHLGPAGGLQLQDGVAIGRVPVGESFDDTVKR